MNETKVYPVEYYGVGKKGKCSAQATLAVSVLIDLASGRWREGGTSQLLDK